jgi:hypothetical protein
MNCISSKHTNREIMIPALIIWLCKKYIASKAAKRLKETSTIIGILLITCGCISASFAQTSKFAIKRNGSVIGQMSFTYNQDGDNVFLKMSSKVNTRFIFKIDVETQDYAHFKNGKLYTSTVNRSVNGDPKDQKETKLTNNYYQTSIGRVIKQPINYNMMLLYTKEPVNIAEVYSDNFQCFVPIIKNGEHQYRIKLPDGNYNDYLFVDGICKVVTVNHSLYTIKMERV